MCAYYRLPARSSNHLILNIDSSRFRCLYGVSVAGWEGDEGALVVILFMSPPSFATEMRRKWRAPIVTLQLTQPIAVSAIVFKFFFYVHSISGLTPFANIKGVYAWAAVVRLFCATSRTPRWKWISFEISVVLVVFVALSLLRYFLLILKCICGEFKLCRTVIKQSFNNINQ